MTVYFIEISLFSFFQVCYFCYMYPSYEGFFVISELGAVSLM